MGSLATNADIELGEHDWGQISNEPAMYECAVNEADVYVLDFDNKEHKITFKKGAVLNIDSQGETLYLSWKDSDIINS